MNIVRKYAGIFNKTGIVVIAVIILMAGCAGVPLIENSAEIAAENIIETPANNYAIPPQFPAPFIGTWERINRSSSNITLTLTTTTLKANNQNYHWNISLISGDTYTLESSLDSNFKGTIYLKLIGNNLEIIDAYDMQNASVWSGSDDDWTGTWKIK